ncbi:MAG TPA: hypothetical protein VHD81_12750 [Mycobacteriales bacterium]|nr:hypothetical protein [Mycobacteriales bacterium]
MQQQLERFGSNSHELASAPAPAFTQLGTLALSHVIQVRSLRSHQCPAPAAAFSDAESGDAVSCDPRAREVYLLGPPIVDERDVDATTVSHVGAGGGWSVFLQLTPNGAESLSNDTGEGDVEVVYNGVVIEGFPSASEIHGGLVQVSGLTKHKARRIAVALNPS